MLEIIRKYTDRPTVLYTDKKLDPFKWKEIKSEHKNVFYIRGEYLNLDHLDMIFIRKAYHVNLQFIFRSLYCLI